jgi:cell division initiation protein
MKIAPIDITHKIFGKKMFGLDALEVHDYLRDVADQMEELVRDRNRLKEQLREKEIAMMDLTEKEEALKTTLNTAAKMSQQIKEAAEKETELILHDARQKADIIVKDARESLRNLYKEISDLKRTRTLFEVGLKSLVQAHLSLLDQGHAAIPNPVSNEKVEAKAPQVDL